ncbi:DnaJ subfamily C member 11 [Tetrabaena socialis]|uniref:DnaJ subfamily C member 11 n=1 Tax=Tetrabaena socialis TaxID=47790 RepID=A0A2J8AD56_9CHLO|nr:DnaJ subfamily C member 11 [Tetrabaena socialis]|eukprot:PNH10448.1 DnaJ subfamily C member 11 [Tetrabaena socialis]
MAGQDFWGKPVEDYEYYAVLNVPRDATDEDIRRAYRNLAQSYHPDKHTDPELKEKAQEAFGKLQEAYEVLSDPVRRQIYDVYGKAGLEAGAAAECSLIGPVARRKARSEAAKRPAGGLVVLDAVYGSVEPYIAEGGPQQQAVAAAAANGTTEGAAEPAAGSSAAAATPTPGGGTAVADASGGGRGGAAADGGLEAEASSSISGQQEPGGAEQADVEQQQPPPPPWLTVTTALQYLVTDSRLVLHPGVPKKNQMGFADPTPGASTVRQLYVAYLYGGQVYEVTVDDTQGLQLPGAGEAVADAARAQGLLRLGAAALRVPELLLPPGSGGGAAGTASASGTPAPSPRA